MPVVSGTSAKGEWCKQDYVIQTIEQYPKHVCFQVFGKDKIDNANIQLNGTYTVHFDIDSREYNGRWYTQCNAWKVENKDNYAQPAQPQQAPPQAQYPQQAPRADYTQQPLAPSNNDLPF